MLTHIVTMTFKADTPAGQAEKIVAALMALPASLPQIKEYRAGTDLGLVEGNFDLGLVATFEDEAGYRAYSTAPAHLAIIEELVRPYVDRRAAIQFSS
jgi:Stress responsive A/B Barrel Domain